MQAIPMNSAGHKGSEKWMKLCHMTSTKCLAIAEPRIANIVQPWRQSIPPLYYHYNLRPIDLKRSCILLMSISYLRAGTTGVVMAVPIFNQIKWQKVKGYKCTVHAIPRLVCLIKYRSQGCLLALYSMLIKGGVVFWTHPWMQGLCQELMEFVHNTIPSLG